MVQNVRPHVYNAIQQEEYYISFGVIRRIQIFRGPFIASLQPQFFATKLVQSLDIQGHVRKKWVEILRGFSIAFGHLLLKSPAQRRAVASFAIVYRASRLSLPIWPG